MEKVTKVNGIAITSPEKVLEALRGIKVGAQVSLTISREGEENTVSYDTPERPLLPGDGAGQNASLPLADRSGLRPLKSGRDGLLCGKTPASAQNQDKKCKG